MDSRTARLEARLTVQNHSVIQHAAALRGQSVTDFVDALLKPQSPTRGLKKAAKAHQMLIERT